MQLELSRLSSKAYLYNSEGSTPTTKHLFSIEDLLNTAIMPLTFMFRIEIREVIDMELKNYTIQKVFCHKNSDRETDSGICLEGSQKEKAFFLMIKKRIKLNWLKSKGLFLLLILFPFNLILFFRVPHTNNYQCTSLSIHK